MKLLSLITFKSKEYIRNVDNYGYKDNWSRRWNRYMEVILSYSFSDTRMNRGGRMVHSIKPKKNSMTNSPSPIGLMQAGINIHFLKKIIT